MRCADKYLSSSTAKVQRTDAVNRGKGQNKVKAPCFQSADDGTGLHELVVIPDGSLTCILPYLQSLVAYSAYIYVARRYCTTGISLFEGVLQRYCSSRYACNAMQSHKQVTDAIGIGLASVDSPYVPLF